MMVQFCLKTLPSSSTQALLNHLTPVATFVPRVLPFTLRELWRKKTNCVTTRRRLNRNGRSGGRRTLRCMRRSPRPAASRSTTCWRCCRIPAAQLHMGHVRNYSIGDALARHMWMRGYNVLHPMGWDAFGLPAENAALKNNTPPREWTLANIAAMKRQMRAAGHGLRLGDGSDHLPARLLPLEPVVLSAMYERGLAYRKKSKVNWCPECADGAGQRAGGRWLLLAA